MGKEGKCRSTEMEQRGGGGRGQRDEEEGRRGVRHCGDTDKDPSQGGRRGRAAMKVEVEDE